MSTKTEGWEELNEYGRQYHAEVQQGQGLQYPTTDDRSPKQKELAEQIITATTPYLYSIAQRMVFGSGFTISVPEKRILRANHARGRVPLAELVQEASLLLISNLGKFDPIRGGMSTFIGQYASAAIFRYTRSENVHYLADMVGEEYEEKLSSGSTPEETIIQNNQQQAISRLFATLSPLEEMVMRGIAHGKGLNEIENELYATPVSPEAFSIPNLRQVQKRATAKLKRKAKEIDFSF